MVSVPSNITAAPGETFTLPITVSAVSGLAGYYIELGYSDSLEFVHAQNGPLAAAWPVPVTYSLTGRCTLAGYGAAPITGPGTLVQVQLRVKPSTPLGHTTTLYFRKLELNDGALIASTQSGTVTVADIAVLGMPVSLDLLPGEEFTLPIELRDAGGMLGFMFSLSYAPNLLEFLGTTPGTLPTGWGAPTVNTAINGRLTIGAYGTQAFSGSATVINLRFRLREDAPLDQTTTLEIYSAELNDGALPVVYGSMLIHIVSEHPMPLGPPVWIILVLLLGYMILRHSRERGLPKISYHNCFAPSGPPRTGCIYPGRRFACPGLSFATLTAWNRKYQWELLFKTPFKHTITFPLAPIPNGDLHYSPGRRFACPGLSFATLTAWNRKYQWELLFKTPFKHTIAFPLAPIPNGDLHYSPGQAKQRPGIRNSYSAEPCKGGTHSLCFLEDPEGGNDGGGIVTYSCQEGKGVCEHPLPNSQKRILECWNSPNTGFRRNQITMHKSLAPHLPPSLSELRRTGRGEDDRTVCDK